MEEPKKKVSNPRIYKLTQNENPETRKKRIGRIEKDVKDRLTMLAQYTGARAFPMMAPALEQKAIIRILVEKGICTEDEVEDMYHILVDEKIQDFESKKEEIKNQITTDKSANLKGLVLPGGRRLINGKIVKA